MAIEITMPQLSDTMDQGTILTWHKQEGDRVSRGDALAEVATDKADLEIESFHEGVLLKIQSPAGTTVKVGSVIALVGEEGEQISVDKPQQAAESKPQPAAAEAKPAAAEAKPAQESSPQPAPQPQPTQPSAQQSSGAEKAHLNGDRVKISPLARNLAETYGVDQRQLSGSGEGGRIVKRDVERFLGRNLGPDEVESAVAGTPAPAAAAPAQEPQPAAARPQPTQAPIQAGEQPLSRMRAAIASQMVKSKTTIPHFYVSGKIEVDALLRLRETLKIHPHYEGITINHLIIKAVGLALRAVPRINCSYQEGTMIQPAEVNVGIVTALEDGLLIPVVRNADSSHLADLVADARALVQRARAGRPKPDDLVGGTFSVSNIGKAEVENFSAIISPGQGAILAVGSVLEDVIVKNGQIRAGKVMRVTLSVDHRIIDGVVAGEFVTELKRLLEEPVLLLA